MSKVFDEDVAVCVSCGEQFFTDSLLSLDGETVCYGCEEFYAGATRELYVSDDAKFSVMW